MCDSMSRGIVCAYILYTHTHTHTHTCIIYICVYIYVYMQWVPVIKKAEIFR
jgi:hypothetical protein